MQVGLDLQSRLAPEDLAPEYLHMRYASVHCCHLGEARYVVCIIVLINLYFSTAPTIGLANGIWVEGANLQGLERCSGWETIRCEDGFFPSASPSNFQLPSPQESSHRTTPLILGLDADRRISLGH
jgi:hypothetical protein